MPILEKSLRNSIGDRMPSLFVSRHSSMSTTTPAWPIGRREANSKSNFRFTLCWWQSAAKGALCRRDERQLQVSHGEPLAVAAVTHGWPISVTIPKHSLAQRIASAGGLDHVQYGPLLCNLLQAVGIMLVAKKGKLPDRTT